MLMRASMDTMLDEYTMQSQVRIETVASDTHVQASDAGEEESHAKRSTYTKYIVLAVASANLFVGIGYSNTFGVFQEYYRTSIFKDERPDKIIVIGSTTASLYLILGAFTGRFADLVGYRVSLLIGTALMVGSMFAASVSTTYLQIFLSQGLGFGLGVAFSYLPAVSISRQYWKQNHGAASAIVVSGGALGGCILPYLVRTLISHKGLPTTFRILGYLAVGILVPCTFLLRPAKTMVPIWRRSRFDRQVTIFDLSLLHNAKFNALLLACTVAMIGFLPRYFLIPESAVHQGVGSLYASWLLGLMNGLSIIGRIGIGVFADRFGKVTALTLSFLLCGLGHFMFWLPGVSISEGQEATVTAMFTLFVVYIGVFGSGFIALFPVVIAHLFGSEDLASKQGLLNTVVGIGTLAGPSAVYAIVGDGSVRHWAIGIRNQIVLHGGDASIDEYPDKRLSLDQYTHIVTKTCDFPDYYDAFDQLKVVVKPAWIDACVAGAKLANPRRYSPDPNLFMSDVVVSCAALPEGDSEAIAGGVLAMGGNYTSKLTTQTTHIVTTSMEHEMIEQAQAKNLPVMIVLPHWFDDCLKLGKKINEGPYSFPEPDIHRISEKAPPHEQNADLYGASNPDPSQTDPKDTRFTKKALKVLQKKQMVLDRDLNISDQLRHVLENVIADNGGRVVADCKSADMLICKYRTGENYIAAASRRIDVGNLAWFFHLIVHDKWTSPFRRLLHYPVPKEKLQGFDKFKICLSNYQGEARTYLENLIEAIGAEYTKTLRQTNTHLVTGHPKSEKVAAAQDWNIHVVNHLWLEESYAKWEVQSITNHKYSHFPTRTNLSEVVGRTEIDREVINRKFLRQKPTVVNGTISDGKARNRTSIANAVPPQITTPATNRVAARDKENVTPSTVGSRASKAAAAAKLHEMTSDIALFEKERKRVGGVVYGGRRKRDGDRVDSSKKRSAEPTEETHDSTTRAPKRPRVEDTSAKMHLIISGYKPWVGKPKKEDQEIRQLRELGIVVVDHPSQATHIAMPRFMRTPKVLVAVAFHPVFLDTKYLEDCLEKNEYLEPQGYHLKDVPSKENYHCSFETSLKRSKEHQGQLLKGKKLFCLENIIGGIDTYQEIAEANGTSVTPYRGRQLPADADDGDDDELILLSNSNNKEDSRMWAKFIKSATEIGQTPRIVDREWLLSSAMFQEVKSLESNELNPER